LKPVSPVLTHSIISPQDRQAKGNPYKLAALRKEFAASLRRHLLSGVRPKRPSSPWVKTPPLASARITR